MVGEVVHTTANSQSSSRLEDGIPQTSSKGNPNVSGDVDNPLCLVFDRTLAKVAYDVKRNSQRLSYEPHILHDATETDDTQEIPSEAGALFLES